MRSQSKRIFVRGVTTMRFCVVFLLVLTTFNPGAVTQGQTPRQRAKQTAVSKPRSETVRICQGVPIPEGYVIIAYMTSSACPHGAYVLRKQDDSESSLAVNGGARQSSEKSAERPKTAPEEIVRSTAQPRVSSTQSSKRSSPERNSTEPRTLPAQPAKDTASSARASASMTRPRRAGDPSQTTN